MAAFMPHKRYFRIAGISVEVVSDLPFSSNTFDPKFDAFRIDGPGKDLVVLHHHFPPTPQPDFAQSREVYRKAPWAIFETENNWVYGEIVPQKGPLPFNRVAVFNQAYTHGHFYHDTAMKTHYLEGGLTSLTLLPTDQILFSQVLAGRNGCYLHAAGVIMNDRGYAFVGHSEAGKSTITRMLKNKGTVLCDDRIIVRKQPDGFYVHGTWSHGDIPDVSPASAPLAGIFFLHQSDVDHISKVADRTAAMKCILPCLIKPFVTARWWHCMLDVVEEMTTHVPCYDLSFNKKGGIVDMIGAFPQPNHDL